jgi:hypothetical protein
LSAAQIQHFLKIRQGPDGIDGTPDDYIFNDLGEIQTALGLNPSQVETLSPLVGLNDPTMHIRSIGHSGPTLHELNVVARKGSGQPQILYWKE